MLTAEQVVLAAIAVMDGLIATGTFLLDVANLVIAHVAGIFALPAEQRTGPLMVVASVSLLVILGTYVFVSALVVFLAAFASACSDCLGAVASGATSMLGWGWYSITHGVSTAANAVGAAITLVAHAFQTMWATQVCAVLFCVAWLVGAHIAFMCCVELYWRIKAPVDKSGLLHGTFVQCVCLRYRAIAFGLWTLREYGVMCAPERLLFRSVVTCGPFSDQTIMWLAIHDQQVWQTGMANFWPVIAQRMEERHNAIQKTNEAIRAAFPEPMGWLEHAQQHGFCCTCDVDNAKLRPARPQLASIEQTEAHERLVAVPLAAMYGIHHEFRPRSVSWAPERQSTSLLSSLDWDVPYRLDGTYRFDVRMQTSLYRYDYEAAADAETRPHQDFGWTQIIIDSDPRMVGLQRVLGWIERIVRPVLAAAQCIVLGLLEVFCMLGGTLCGAAVIVIRELAVLAFWGVLILAAIPLSAIGLGSLLPQYAAETGSHILFGGLLAIANWAQDVAEWFGLTHRMAIEEAVYRDAPVHDMAQQQWVPHCAGAFEGTAHQYLHQ